MLIGPIRAETLKEGFVFGGVLVEGQLAAEREVSAIGPEGEREVSAIGPEGTTTPSTRHGHESPSLGRDNNSNKRPLVPHWWKMAKGDVLIGQSRAIWRRKPEPCVVAMVNMSRQVAPAQSPPLQRGPEPSSAALQRGPEPSSAALQRGPEPYSAALQRGPEPYSAALQRGPEPYSAARPRALLCSAAAPCSPST
ncbi:unnamed protein product [Arctogadus glacialis]